MADIALQPRVAKPQIREATAWDQLRTNRNWLGFWFMLPAMAFLIFFLAYPLGLGIWISFTDAKIGRPGQFIGIENYEWLSGDSIFWLSVFNTLLYTTIASAIKFAVGLYLALGWSGIMLYDSVVTALPRMALWYVLAGGALYSLGVIFHAWRRLRFQNVIWHCFVLLGAACHYTAVLDVVVLS